MSRLSSSDDISVSNESIEEFMKKKNGSKRPVSPALPFKPIAPVTKQKLFTPPIPHPTTTQRTYKVTASGGKILIPTLQEELDLKKRIEETAKKVAEKKVVAAFLDPGILKYGGNWERAFLRRSLGYDEYMRVYEFRNNKRKVVRDKQPRWRMAGYDTSDSNVEFKYDSMVYGKYLDSERVILAAQEARAHSYDGKMTKVAVKYEVDTIYLPPNFKVSASSLNPKYAAHGEEKYIRETYEYDLKSLCVPYIEMENGTYMEAYRYYYYDVPTYLLSHPLMWYYNPKEHGIVNIYEEYTREGVEYRKQIDVQFIEKKFIPRREKSIRRGKKMHEPLLDGSDFDAHQ